MKYKSDEIGKKIKEERLKLGWSQEGLGESLGFTSKAKQISVYEKGTTIPPLSTLLKMCEIFNCELGYLLGEEEYSSGTKIHTKIKEEIGLNPSSIESLKYITGTDVECIEHGMSADCYRRIINDLLSNPLFTLLMTSIEIFDRYSKTVDNLYEKASEKYGEDIWEKANNYYASNIDYFHDEESEKLDEIYYEAMVEIDNILDKSYESKIRLKVLRYEVIEAFSNLLDDLYPKNK